MASGSQKRRIIPVFWRHTDLARAALEGLQDPCSSRGL